MERVLNITNGDSAVNIMKQAGLPGVFLPWRDVLHEGPVPAGLTLEELSDVRAHFIAERGWGEYAQLKADFKERDDLLKSSREYAKVVLWFEHDLYDQLQILQILDWFAEHRHDGPKLSMICTEQYLGMATATQMKALRQYEEAITNAQLDLAKRAWHAFRSPTPEDWWRLLDEDTSALPFLEGAVLRMLEEYPSALNGLSRTAQQALRLVAAQARPPGRLFAAYQETEERRFLGDSSFWVVLKALLDSTPPLLQLPEGKSLALPSTPDQVLSITADGEQVLAGEKNWLDTMAADRWLGGVHLCDDNIWRWNAARRELIQAH